MSLAKKINEDLIAAMKSKEAQKVSTLRLVKAAINNAQIEKKADELKDADVEQVLQKQLKQTKESLESYEKAGRAELIEKERSEITILESYLPKQLTAGEIEALVKAAISEVQAAGKQDMGKVMKAVMPKVKGRSDGKAVNAVVAKLLAG